MAARLEARPPLDLGSHEGCPYVPVIVGCPKRATPNSPKALDLAAGRVYYVGDGSMAGRVREESAPWPLLDP